MGMTKWIVGLVILIIVVGVGWWLFKDNIAVWRGGMQDETPAPTADPLASWGTYASSTMGVSIKFPQGYSANGEHAYTQVSPQKPIHGVALVVPSATATGTNLSSDSYIAVEQLPRARNCTGDIFVRDNVRPREVVEGTVTYSVATTSGAAAGNRYEEHVWAVKGSSPCTAVRYYLHTTVLENYPAGAVREYNRAALLEEFDAIRRSLVLTAQ